MSNRIEFDKIPFNSIIYKDAMNKEDGMPTLPSKSFDLGIADYIWNIDYDGAIGSQGYKTKTDKLFNDSVSYESYLFLCLDWFVELMRICKVVIIACGRQNLGLWYLIGQIYTEFYDSKFERIKQKNIKKYIEPKDLLIIYRNDFKRAILSSKWLNRYNNFLSIFKNPSLSDLNKDFLKNELIWLMDNHAEFMRSAPLEFPDLLVHYKKNGVYGSRIATFNLFDTFLFFGDIRPFYRNNVFEILATCGILQKKKLDHPCPKSFEVYYELVKGIKEKINIETLIDPFLGSGTSIGVAKALNIKYLGYEIDETYSNDIKIQLDYGKKLVSQSSLTRFLK